MKKNAIEWLQDVYVFSLDPDEKTYHRLVNRLYREAHIGLNSLNLRGKEHVNECADYVNRLFWLIAGNQPKSAPVAMPYSATLTYQDDPDGPILRVFYSDHSTGKGGRWSLAAGVLHLMHMHQIRGVSICGLKGCNKLTFSTRPTSRVYCSNKCKQQAHRDRQKEATNGS